MLPLLAALLYALSLFAFASWADRSGSGALRRLRPSAYALAIAVYCTSWTYYGAVGTAVTDGWSYLPIYLGPIIVYLFGHNFLKKLIDTFKAEGANSLSDFIGGRFGNSRGVAAMVTILALLGSIPYLALQLRSLSTTFALISGNAPQMSTMGLTALGLAIFAIVYGTRRYDPASRNDAVLFAVGFESFFKLGALLLAGGLAAFLFVGFDSARTDLAIARLSDNFAPSNIDADFFVIILLSMAAIFCLPRQFYVTVIEARSGEDLARARWPFIAYMLLTTLVVLPISAAGLAFLPPETRPDIFVLLLPISQQLDAVALIVFLGGFSAATAMVVVETIALATMISNDLFAPALLRNRHYSGEGDLGRILLTVRRATIIAIMGSALIWALAIQDSQRLASIGLVAFAAMAQFAPILILAVYGANRDALAAKAGLGAGLLLWIYTLAMPQVVPPAMIEGLAGTALNPIGLLGIDGLSPISHGTLWSLGANLTVFALVTMRRVKPAALPSLFRDVQPVVGSVATLGDLKAVVARFVGTEVTDSAFGKLEPAQMVDGAAARKAERLIASVVGLPSARAFLSSALHGSDLTHAEVARLLEDTFLVTMGLMGLSTFVVGLLPSYASIGVAAPIMLVVMRLIQGLALGGEYGGAATYVAEHAPNNKRGLYTSFIQTTATLGLFAALLVVIGTRTVMGEEAFKDWGWRIPFLISIVLLAVSMWIRMQLAESPVFQKMKDEGTTSKAPLTEAFGQWKNAKWVIVALLGAVAGQAVVWYTGQFYAMFFLEKMLLVDGATTNIMIAIALAIGTPFFIFFGWLSDKIGRKWIIMTGCALAVLTYFPAFHALSNAANPALAQAAISAPVSVTVNDNDCSLQFDPIGKNKFDSKSCDIAKSYLAKNAINYSVVDAPAGTVASVKIGDKVITAPDPAKVTGDDKAAAIKAFGGEVITTLQAAGYPVKDNPAAAKDPKAAKKILFADPAQINKPAVIAILTYLVLLVTMVYGPIAALLVELFPTRIRYTSMSLPYHIGNGWFGGFLPTTAFAMVAATGDIYYGLWYPIVVAGLTLVAGILFLPETFKRNIDD